MHGFWLYLLAALQTILLNHIPYHFHGQLDGKDWQRDLLMLIISNGKSEGGGFKIAPHASLEDGLFNLIAVQSISRLRMLISLLYFMQGTHARLPYVETGEINEIKLTSDRPMQIHADGEVMAGFDSKVKNITIRVHPLALKVAMG